MTVESENTAQRMEEERHAAEVRYRVNLYYPNGKAMADYIESVEKARGRVDADRLRADCRKAWTARRNELAGQA